MLKRDNMVKRALAPMFISLCLAITLCVALTGCSRASDPDSSGLVENSQAEKQVEENEGAEDQNLLEPNDLANCYRKSFDEVSASFPDFGFSSYGQGWVYNAADESCGFTSSNGDVVDRLSIINPCPYVVYGVAYGDLRDRTESDIKTNGWSLKSGRYISGEGYSRGYDLFVKDAAGIIVEYEDQTVVRVELMGADDAESEASAIAAGCTEPSDTPDSLATRSWNYATWVSTDKKHVFYLGRREGTGWFNACYVDLRADELVYCGVKERGANTVVVEPVNYGGKVFEFTYENGMLVSDDIVLERASSNNVSRLIGTWKNDDASYEFDEEMKYHVLNEGWGFFFVLNDNQMVMSNRSHGFKIVNYSLSGNTLTVDGRTLSRR